MRSHFKFLFCCGHGCSCCTKRFRWRQKEKSEKVQPSTLFKLRKKERRFSHLPYIETHPENEKVFTFFMKALSRSTITGVNRLASSRNVIRKTLWCVVSLFGLIGFMYQAFMFTAVYNSSPTEVVLRVENEGTVTFPSVTVCNNNRIRRSEFCKLFPDRCLSNDTRLEISEEEFLRIHKEALVEKQFDFRYQLGHSSNIVSGCIFKGSPHLRGNECLQRFSKSFDPDFGNCFSFSTRGRKNGRHLSAREADFWQDENDLTLLLDAQNEEFTEMKREPGLILTVHSDSTLPDIHTDGIKLETGVNYNFAVQQSITKLLPFPYKTNCTDFSALPWVSEDVRLSPRMCSVRCSQHFQFFNCGYVTEKLSMFYQTLPWDPDEINKEQMECAKKVESKTKRYCKTLCGLPCEDSRFEVAVDGRRLTKQAVSVFSTTRRVEDIIHNRWDNLVMVRIYFKTIERKIYEHVPKYDVQELFSHLGGYSGVWLGFSLLNLYELLEIIVATLNFATSKMQKPHRSESPAPPPLFYTQSSKKFYEDAIVANSLFFARNNGTLKKLKTKHI